MSDGAASAAAPASPPPPAWSTTDDRFSCNICFDAVTEPVVTQCGHLYCWPCLYRWLAPGMTPPERQSLNLPPLLTPVNASRRACPVCKAPTAVATVVPIYVRNLHDDDTPTAASSRDQSHINDQQDQPDNDGTTGIPSTGLRQRRAGEPTTPPTTTVHTHDPATAVVPTRPAAHRSEPLQPPSTSTAALAVRGAPPGMPRPTMAQELAMIMHQALHQAAQDDAVNGNANHVQQQYQYETVPPLHYREQAFRNPLLDSQLDGDADPDSTQFLSRLLLGLSCFVLFCLFLF